MQFCTRFQFKMDLFARAATKLALEKAFMTFKCFEQLLFLFRI